MLNKNKTKFLTFILAVLTVLSACSVQSSVRKPAPSESFVKIFHTLKIDCKDKKNKECPDGLWRSSGSGIIVNLHPNIKSTIILTAGHVCETMINEKTKKLIKSEKQKVFVQFYDGSIHESEILLTSHPDSVKRTGDLCAVKVDSFTKKHPKIAISTKPAQVGDRLISFAAPGGVYHPPVVPIFHGIFSGDIDDITSITSIPARGGSSGAAVMNEKYEIVGILFAVSTKTQHISLVVNYKTVKEFTREIKNHLLLNY